MLFEGLFDEGGSAGLCPQHTLDYERTRRVHACRQHGCLRIGPEECDGIPNCRQHACQKRASLRRRSPSVTRVETPGTHDPEELSGTLNGCWRISGARRANPLKGPSNCYGWSRPVWSGAPPDIAISMQMLPQSLAVSVLAGPTPFCGQHCFSDGRAARHCGSANIPRRFRTHGSDTLHHALLHCSAHNIVREKWHAQGTCQSLSSHTLFCTDPMVTTARQIVHNVGLLLPFAKPPRHAKCDGM